MCARAGSPPRVRGKGIALTFTARLSRITPACAGKRVAHDPKVIYLGDHPRVCGEKQHATSQGSPLPGSPPRVRGKATSLSGIVPLSRITPACAGKRNYIICVDGSRSDHPRVCGEKTKNLPVARFFSLIRNGSCQVHVTSHITDSLSGSLTVLCAHLHME